MRHSGNFITWSAAVLALCLMALALPAPTTAHTPTSRAALAGELIIRLLAESALSAQAQPTGPHAGPLGAALRSAGAVRAEPLGDSTYLVTFRRAISPGELAPRFASLPGVIYAEPNYERGLLRATNDPLFGQQWHLSNIQAQTAWETTTGQPISIALLDTGISPTHPDLQGRIGGGYDFVHDDADPTDDEGHGTHIAGIVAANADNGEGVAGICWNCTLLPVKVLGERGRGNDAVIAQGIRYAVDQGVRIIGMSLGGPEESRALRDAVTYAVDRNVLIVAASGNDFSRGTVLNYPAAYPQVLAVAANDERDTVAPFSTTGVFVDLAAPGVNILSTYWSRRAGDTYATASGTSEAAPQVVGAAALLLSIRPELSARQLAELLQASADDVDVPGVDQQTGYGRLNLARAVAFAADPAALASSRIEGRVSGAAPEQVTVTLDTGQQVQPDANGVYSFEELPAGSYTIVASLPDGQQQTGQVTLTGTPLSVATLDLRFDEAANPAFAPVAPTGEADVSYFPETGHTLSGAFRDFWQRSGGLSVFGYPISEPFTERGEDGRDYLVQFFERNRFELNPENDPPYDVLLGRLGDTLLRENGRDWFAFPKGVPRENCRFFAETGHSVCGAFLHYWRANGLEIDGQAGTTAAENLALFGLPLSEPQIETFSDGNSYIVQWFERARFEDHGPDGVLLGLLGKETTGER